MDKDVFYMKLALQEASKAYYLDEVPIGCVIVFHDQVLVSTYNRKTIDQIATSHAEILAINEACHQLGSWYLDECILYTTVEPCLMCTGAIIQSRIKRVVYGCSNQDFGYLSQLKNSKIEVVSGILEDECVSILRDFFQKKRKQHKEEVS